MYCRKCGEQNDDNAYNCVKCGEPILRPRGEPPKNIPNYLAQSILVTLFCCQPFGIVSIVFAAQVNSKIQAGDIRGAVESSRKAKMWAWWALGVGLLIQIAYFIFVMIMVSHGSL